MALVGRAEAWEFLIIWSQSILDTTWPKDPWMSEISKGLVNGLTNYGDPEFARYLRRSFAKSMGYTNESLDKPIVGICYTESSFNNCHRHFPEMLEAVTEY